MATRPFQSRLRWLPILLVCFLAAPLLVQGHADWTMHVIDSAAGFGGSLSEADGILFADVDGDGDLDAVTGYHSSGKVRACLNPGVATVRSTWSCVTTGNATFVEEAVFTDLDGDGAYDTVASMNENQRISVMWGPTNFANFLTAASWSTATITNSIGLNWMQSTPMNVDARNGIDLVSSGQATGAQIGWWESPTDPRDMSAWNFHPFLARDVGWVNQTTPSDMDGDGDLDVVVTDRQPPTGTQAAYWMENPGTGNLTTLRAPWTSHNIGGGIVDMLYFDLKDLDGDGLVDMIAARQSSNKIAAFRRLNATGTSWSLTTIAWPAGMGDPKGVSVIDVDYDKRLDIVMTAVGAGLTNVAWFSPPALPTSPFSATGWTQHVISTTGGKYDRLTAIDFDGDGDLDVATTEQSPGTNYGMIWFENPARPGVFPGVSIR